MRLSRRHVFIGAALVLALAGAAVARYGAQGRFSTFENQVYVWQTSWTQSVAKAARETAPAVDSFLVFAGAFTVNGGRLACRRSLLDWETLKLTGRPASIVMRADASLSRTLAGGELEATVQGLASEAKEVLNNAVQNGIVVSGLQLDYDCPTSKLADYARLLKALKKLLPEVRFSITALPTWLGDDEFRSLLLPLDNYVLQVHALEKPTSAGSPPALCDSGRVSDWASRAAKFRKPFYVALPTYGYRLLFDSSGEFAAVGAEGSQPDVPPGYQMIEVTADPFELASVVKGLRAKPPRYCRGIAWFRMPVDTDDLNWSWPTLQSVMAGNEPVMAFTAEIRKPREDLCEIWMKNAGDFRPSKPLRVVANPKGKPLRAYDCVGGYSGALDAGAAQPGLVLTGPAPRRDQDVMAAWCLMEPGCELTVGNVEVIQ